MDDVADGVGVVAAGRGGQLDAGHRRLFGGDLERDACACIRGCEALGREIHRYSSHVERKHSSPEVYCLCPYIERKFRARCLGCNVSRTACVQSESKIVSKTVCCPIDLFEVVVLTAVAEVLVRQACGPVVVVVVVPSDGCPVSHGKTIFRCERGRPDFDGARHRCPSPSENCEAAERQCGEGAESPGERRLRRGVPDSAGLGACTGARQVFGEHCGLPLVFQRSPVRTAGEREARVGGDEPRSVRCADPVAELGFESRPGLGIAQVVPDADLAPRRDGPFVCHRERARAFGDEPQPAHVRLRRGEVPLSVRLRIGADREAEAPALTGREEPTPGPDRPHGHAEIRSRWGRPAAFLDGELAGPEPDHPPRFHPVRETELRVGVERGERAFDGPAPAVRIHRAHEEVGVWLRLPIRVSAFAAPAPRVAAHPSITIAAARRMHAVSERPRCLQPPSPAASPRIDAGALPSGAVERGFDCAPQGAEGREPGGQLELGQYPRARLGSARLGSARLGSARLGSARLGSARLGSARLGSARLGSARLGSARLGSARLLIILFAASSHSSAFKNIALPLHGCRQGCRRAGREPGKRCPVASTEAAKPLGRDEGAKNARTGNPRSDSGRSRPNGRWLESYGTKPIAQSDGDVARRAALEPRARSARAVRERRGGDPPRPRAALGQGHDFAYPMCPSRHFRFVREYHHIIFMIQYFGITCRVLADVRSDFVYRTDKNGPIASDGAEDRSARGRGERRPRGRGEGSSRPTLGREGGPRRMRRSRTGSRARYGRCSPMSGRTATTARVRRRSGRSDAKERWRAERWRTARRGVMANRSDRHATRPLAEPGGSAPRCFAYQRAWARSVSAFAGASPDPWASRLASRLTVALGEAFQRTPVRSARGASPESVRPA